MRALRAALAVLLCASLAGIEISAQAREWWDIYEEAKTVIEDGQASEDQLNSARRKLLQVTRSKDTEGNLPTYNPSVRIDYLPFFYLGWAEVRLGRYDDAAKRFARSEEIGFITGKAPKVLRTRFQSLSQLLVQLKPASETLRSAQKNSSVKECLGTSGSPSGSKLRDAIARLEGLVASPSDAGSLKSSAEALEGFVGECVREVAGARLAKYSGEYKAARDAVFVQGIVELLPAGTRQELEAAVAAGNQADTRGEERDLRSATRELTTLLAKVTAAVDTQVNSLVREAGSVARGNEGALNEQNQLGSRLSSAASRARSQKASGKEGPALASVVSTGTDLKGLVDQARQALQPILQAKRASLQEALDQFRGWTRTRSCELGAVDSAQEASQVEAGAGTALNGSSADLMESAQAKLASVRSDVETKLKDALPRSREQARGIVGSADSVIANITDAGQKSRGEQLKQAVNSAVSGSDICGIENATASLRSWVGTVAPRLEEGRRTAIARNQPHLDRAKGLLDGFGGILDAATVTALQDPHDRLSDLLKNSYDVAAMDAAGNEVKGVADRADGEVRGQMQKGIEALDQLMQGSSWAEVSEERRRWLERNQSSVKRAVENMTNPALLARFAREYPRARLEVALVSAFDTLYTGDDAVGAARILEDLGPGFKAGSAALNYALSYVYWWQARAASEDEQEGLIQKARQAFQAAKDLRLDISGLGASPFAPAFVTDMSGL
jgi:hypothetical protein